MRRAAAYLDAIKQTGTAQCISVNGPGYHYNPQTGQCDADE